VNRSLSILEHVPSCVFVDAAVIVQPIASTHHLLHRWILSYNPPNSMAILFPPTMNPAKRIRRTATSVMAGAFDPRPPRDVLTSLLNGVAPYKAVEKEEELRRAKKKEKKERDRARKREMAAQKAQEKHEAGDNAIPNTSCASTSLIIPPVAQPSTSTFWKARPSIYITTAQRSLSITPPPSTSPVLLPSTPISTPGPCDSSSTSRTSSKRPRTPDDFEDIGTAPPESVTAPPQPSRKRKAAVRKGWKGWVEGSPPPSEKLINLDAVPVLRERRTRSGKNFDAIGVGKDSWV
jgi:hypothetical protein